MLARVLTLLAIIGMFAKYTITGSIVIASYPCQQPHTGRPTATSPLLLSLARRKIPHSSNKPPACLPLLALLLSGDINPNPGPRQHNSDIFPCGFCELGVGWNTRAVECMGCDVWFHKSCISMCSREYANINSDVVWICLHCDTPNYSNSIYHSYELELYNSYTTLSRPSIDNLSLSELSTSMNSEVFCPAGFSTPTSTSANPPMRSVIRSRGMSSTTSALSKQTDISKLANKDKNFRVMVANVNGCKDKSSNIETALSHIEPDVFLACETKVDDSIQTSEFLPEGYRKNIIRKDRDKHGVGCL